MQAAEPTRSVAPQQLQRVPSDREDQAALLAQQQETIRAQQDLIRALQQTNNALQETNRLLQQGSGRERAASDYDEMQQIRARARIEGVLADTSADAPATAKATVWDAGGPSHQPPTVQGARTLMLPAPPSAPDEDRLLAHSKPGLGKGSGANWESAASVSDVTRMMSSTHLNAKNQVRALCARQWRAPHAKRAQQAGCGIVR
jgi:hypothetical protein